MSTMPSVGSGTYSPGPNMVCSPEQEKVGTGSIEAIICPVYSDLRIRATVSKFRVKTEAEQQIWNECARLITNAVIYYNMALLSKVYAQKAAANDQQAMAIIRGISPVAWQHVNLFGTFEFSPTESTVELDDIATRY